MCIGRIDLYSCGCFDDIEKHPCKEAGDGEDCAGIGPLITNHYDYQCGECVERKNSNAARLTRIINESRERNVTQITKHASPSHSLRTIDAVDLRYQTLNTPVRPESEKSGPPADANEKKRFEHNDPLASISAFPQYEEPSIHAFDSPGNPKESSSKFGWLFACCFKG